MLKPYRKLSFSIVLSVFTAVFMSGCNMIPGPATETNNNTTAASNTGVNTQTNTANETTADSADVNAKCYNEYYPVSDTVTRVFNTKGTVNTAYTLKHQNITNDGFSEERDFESGVNVKNNWICTDEGLRTAEYTNSVSMDKAQMQLDTISSSGVTLPKEWAVGKEWDTDFKVKADLKAGPISTVADGNVKVANKIVSINDKVTAGGKEYEAARVDSTITISLSMKGNKVPGATVTTKNWYAKGIGLVKQDAGSTLGNQNVEYAGTK